MPDKPIAIFYEHPDWFQPLFAELDGRGVVYEKDHLKGHLFDPCVNASPYSLVVNRVSAYPSAASAPQVVLYVKQYLAYLESIGTRVINGWRSYEVGTSKALQMQIFNKLGLHSPNSRVIHHAGQAAQHLLLLLDDLGLHLLGGNRDAQRGDRTRLVYQRLADGDARRHAEPLEAAGFAVGHTIPQPAHSRSGRSLPGAGCGGS